MKSQHAGSRLAPGGEETARYVEARHNGTYAYDGDQGLADFLKRCRTETRPPTQEVETPEALTKAAGHVRAMLCLHPTRGGYAAVEHLTGLLGPKDAVWVYSACHACEGSNDEARLRLSAERLAAEARRALLAEPNPPHAYVHIEPVTDILTSVHRFARSHYINLLILGRRPPETAIPEANSSQWIRRLTGLVALVTTEGAAGVLKSQSSVRSGILRSPPFGCSLMQVSAARPHRHMSRFLVCITASPSDQTLLRLTPQLVGPQDSVVVHYPTQNAPEAVRSATSAVRRPSTISEVPVAIAEEWRDRLLANSELSEEQITVCVESRSDGGGSLGDVAAAFGCDTIILAYGPQGLGLANREHPLTVIMVPGAT